jgi:hypothetical protein
VPSHSPERSSPEPALATELRPTNRHPVRACHRSAELLSEPLMLYRLRYCGLILGCLLASCGGASDTEAPAQYPPPPPPPVAPSVEPTPLPEPPPQSAAPAEGPSGTPQQPGTPPPPPASTQAATSPPPPGQTPLVQPYPTGQWVYLSGQGWVWVPAGATATEMDGVPYSYLYTPAYGWTWYVSPWGWGPYVYGPWYRHPWHPVGLHGYWLARPGAAGRLGGGWRGGGRR